MCSAANQCAAARGASVGAAHWRCPPIGKWHFEAVLCRCCRRHTKVGSPCDKLWHKHCARASQGGGACHCGVVGRRCCCRCCSTVRVLCFFGLCYMMWRCHTHMPHLPHTLLNAPLSECRVQWPRGKVPSNSRKQVNRASSSPSRPGQTRARPPSRLLPSCCPRALRPALPIGNKGMNN